MTKYQVTTHDDEHYDVEADSIQVDETNSNRVTFISSDMPVAQENNAKSVRPV